MPMHSNRYWFFFLLFVASVTLWFASVATVRLYRYYSLDSRALAQEVTWTVESKIGDRYYLVGTYRFQVGEKSYTGQTLMERRIFRNQWSAMQAIDEYRSRKWPVYFRSSKPEVSTLFKHFPLKETFSALSLVAILLYFIVVGYYVGAKER